MPIALPNTTTPVFGSLSARKTVGSAVVLCSRGYSFLSRMHSPVEWALKCGIQNVILLHCPEDKYSPSFVEDVEEKALALFDEINKSLIFRGKQIHFEFLCCRGLLHENLAELIAQGDVRIVFVGRKMLDYRANEIKRLTVPFFFLV